MKVPDEGRKRKKIKLDHVWYSVDHSTILCLHPNCISFQLFGIIITRIMKLKNETRMRQKMGKEENCTKHTRLPQYKHVDEGYFWLNGSNWLLRVGEGEQSESNSRKKVRKVKSSYLSSNRFWYWRWKGRDQMVGIQEIISKVNEGLPYQIYSCTNLSCVCVSIRIICK